MKALNRDSLLLNLTTPVIRVEVNYDLEYEGEEARRLALEALNYRF